MNKLLTTLSILLIATVSYAQTYTVERVIDGDTLKLTNGERVRLIGIDTPESHDNDKARRDSKRTGQDIETITKMGQEATEFVKGLGLEGKEVRLKFDAQERDKYGRLLAYVYVSLPNETLAALWKRGLFDTDLLGYEVPAMRFTPMNFEGWWENFVINFFLNARIIKSGYATPMTIPPNVKYADLFKELYEEAREQKRGLWRQIKVSDINVNSVSLSVTIFGNAVYPNDDDFAGHCIYLKGNEEIKKEFEGNGNQSYAFLGNKFKYCEVRKTLGKSPIGLMITEDGKVVFESEMSDSYQLIVYEVE